MMSAWKYLKAGFWQRVPLPLLGRVPLNAAALVGFGVAGFDNPLLWAAGAGWECFWLTGTAGRLAFRREVDASERQEKWRRIEERRLQLYNQLPAADRLRHHTIRQTCHALAMPSRHGGPDPSVELFTWLHLKLLLARHHASAGRLPEAADPDLPRLQAGAAIDLTDPAASRMADEAVALLDPRHALADLSQPILPALEAALQRIESGLSATRESKVPADFAQLVKAAAAEATLTRTVPEMSMDPGGIDRMLEAMAETPSAGPQPEHS